MTAQQKPATFTPPSPPLSRPDPLPPWALHRPLMALWYVASRAGDHGRWKPFRRLTHITRYIYVGGQISRRGWAVLESWGVQAILNLRVEWDDRKSGITTPHYLWLPTIDGTPPTVEQLARGATFMHEQVQAQHPIYVHCAAGLGRSPTQVIAYMMTRGLSDAAAIDYIVQRRPFITLSMRQRQRLTEFAAYIARYKLDYSEDNLIDDFTSTQEAQTNVPAIGTDDALAEAVTGDK
jgi:protein-tyrosine phosphatase